jgi:hypothetical protein
MSREEPTTCVFPDALKALVGAGVSTKIEDNPAVLLSHEAGHGIFSVRALRTKRRGALNISFAVGSMSSSSPPSGEPTAP